MKTASIHELKNELSALPPTELMELCLRLAKFKKENKELLTFLLFEAHDLQSYIDGVKAYMDEEFSTLPTSPYFQKKALRKTLKGVNKHIKYAAAKEAEIELLLYFCHKIKQSGIRLESYTVLNNLFQQQVKKIKEAIDSQHEDLQYDYLKQLEKITGL